MKTRTGSYPIGFRRGGGQWQRDVDGLVAWMKANDIDVIDVGRDGDTAIQPFVDAGIRIGSADLKEWNAMISADKAMREEAVATNSEYVRACGARNYFLVMLPENPGAARSENFGYMVESFAALAPVLEEVGGRVAIEGWPGPGALCCTPEGFRAFFKEVPSPAMAINFDPSHLIRMGIDPLRFADEFGDRVTHVHGKDAEILTENLYEYGSELPAIFRRGIPFGSLHWRYTIPGQGVMRWGKVLEILESKGYAGCVSVELEDANFNGSEEGEKAGILHGVRFLAGC